MKHIKTFENHNMKEPKKENYRDKKGSDMEYYELNDYVMDRISIDQRRKARVEWNEPKNRNKDWNDFLKDYADKNGI